MHPLTGPRLKVRRAKRQIKTLTRAEDAILVKAHYCLVRAEYNPKTQKYVYRVSASINPPVDWGVRIGEVAHNLRSALDGLIWQLALITTKTPAPNTQFPIFRVGSTMRKRRGNKIPHFECDGRRMIRDLRPEHQAVIERLQPYKAGRGGRSNLLYALQEINNADKHRLIQVLGAKHAAVSYAAWGDDVVSPLFDYRSVMLKDGAKFGEAAENVNVYPELSAYIAFWQGCPAVRRRPVHPTLVRITEQVSEIIEGFAPEFS